MNLNFSNLSLAMLRPIFLWPKFSVTSFNMISNLIRQGIFVNAVIDVGANVGQFAVAAAKLFPDATIYSFEPNPACLPALTKNVSSLGNVLIYPIAIGDESGEVTFNVNSHSHSSSILSLSKNHLKSFPEAQEVNSIKVQLSTLDAVFDSVELKGPTLLKLDIQGYEAQALRGAAELLKKVDYVVLEASFKPMYEGELLFVDIVSLMATYGFIFARPVGWLTDPNTTEIIQADALFERKQ